MVLVKNELWTKSFSSYQTKQSHLKENGQLVQGNKLCQFIFIDSRSQLAATLRRNANAMVPSGHFIKQKTS